MKRLARKIKSDNTLVAEIERRQVGFANGDSLSPNDLVSGLPVSPKEQRLWWQKPEEAYAFLFELLKKFRNFQK